MAVVGFMAVGHWRLGRRLASTFSHGVVWYPRCRLFTGLAGLGRLGVNLKDDGLVL